MYTSLCNKDIDGVFECLPHSIATAITIVKILNMNFNRRNVSEISFISRNSQLYKLRGVLLFYSLPNYTKWW